LELIRDSMVLKQEEQNTARKMDYDKGKTLRCFKENQLVMKWILGMCGKMEESWNGPYVAAERLGEVNYRIS